MWKHLVTDYLSFSKKERNGIIILLLLIVLFSIVPFFFPFFIKNKTYDPAAFAKEIAALKIKQADNSPDFEKKYERAGGSANGYSSPGSKMIMGELFYFDPNTATAADWKRLGVRDKTIATLQKYVSKGGRFYKPEDIGKIWGLHPDEVKRLLPYVKLQSQAAANNSIPKIYKDETYERPLYKATLVDINDADSSALVALPGIGAKLSKRILNFRNALGGFYKVEQVGETFGLPDSTFQAIKGKLRIDDAPAVRQIDINTATIDELKTHPYLRYMIANAIVQYRSQHGNYSSVADLKKIMVITEDVYQKVFPYLTIH
jgi:competence protein ComEA